MVLAMLHDKQTSLTQQITLKNHIGQLRYFLQDIWRIGKDKIELFPALTKVFENVSLDGNGREVLQLVNELLYKTEVQRILLYADYSGTTTGKELKSDTACASKQVESNRFGIPVDIGIQNIEKILLSKICGGACLKTTGNFKVTTLVFSCNNSQGER